MKRSVTASARRNRVVLNDLRVSHVNYDHQQNVLEDVDVEADSVVELVFSDEDDGGEDMGGMDSSRDKSDAEGSGDDVRQIGGGHPTTAPRTGVLPLPNTVGMSVEEKDQAMMEYRKACNRMYQARSRATKRAIQEGKETEHERSMALRALAVIRGQANGVYQARGVVGMEFYIKGQFMHACRDIRECPGIPVSFPLSSAGEVHAIPCSSRASIQEREAVRSDSDAADPERCAANRDLNIKHSTSLLRIVAKYVRKDRVWCTVSSVISGDQGGKRQSYNRRTAYRVMDLANLVTGLIGDQPNATGRTIRDAFRDYVSELGALKGNVLSRIRRQAAINVFGTPDTNFEFLPVLKLMMEARGHELDFATISSPTMRDVLVGVGRPEDARLRKAAIAKRVSSRNDADRAAAVNWDQGAREAWIEKNKKLLASVSERGARYVESVFSMFSRTLVAREQLLRLYVLDACTGKVFLDCYTLYVIVVFSSNGNIVSIAYAWISNGWRMRALHRCHAYLNSSKSIYPRLQIERHFYRIVTKEFRRQLRMCSRRKFLISFSASNTVWIIWLDTEGALEEFAEVWC